MLPERVFALGGWLAIAAGLLLLLAAFWNPSPYTWGIFEAAAFLIGFGLFFLYVARGARKDRQRLLDSPERPG